MRIAVVTVRPSLQSQYGGAERLFDALVQGLVEAGHNATEVPVVVDETDFTGIQRGYLDCYDLDLSKYDAVISTKAPTWLVRHPRHVCYLVHTIRVFYDMFEQTFETPNREHWRQRELIHQLDTGGLAPPRCRRVFTIGNEVAGRLNRFNGLNATTLHPPLWTEGFHNTGVGDYFFLPGRLHRWKRVDLVIDAFKKVRGAVRLLIAGQGQDEASLRKQAAGDSRIVFLGQVSDDELLKLYAGALAVPFAPMREDYGYVTLEAFASGKPVLTCSDSGEAASIVRDGVSGFVCSPDAVSLSSAMQRLVEFPELSVRMGQTGKSWVKALSWASICKELVTAAAD